MTPVFIAPADALRVIAQDVCKNRFVDVRYENDIAIVRCRVETGARAEATYFALGNFGNIARATMSQTKASEVRMTFTHTTHDAYGNDSEHDAMTMTMPRALADKLKWDNIYNDDLLSLLIAGDSGAKIVVDSTWKQ